MFEVRIETDQIAPFIGPSDKDRSNIQDEIREWLEDIVGPSE